MSPAGRQDPGHRVRAGRQTGERVHARLINASGQRVVELGQRGGLPGIEKIVVVEVQVHRQTGQTRASLQDSIPVKVAESDAMDLAMEFLHGSNVDSVGTVAIAVLGPRRPPLIRGRGGRVVARVDRRAAGEQGMGGGWAAVVLQGAEQWVGADDVVAEVVDVRDTAGDDGARYVDRAGLVVDAGGLCRAVVGQCGVGERDRAADGVVDPAAAVRCGISGDGGVGDRRRAGVRQPAAVVGRGGVVPEGASQDCQGAGIADPAAAAGLVIGNSCFGNRQFTGIENPAAAGT